MEKITLKRTIFDGILGIVETPIKSDQPSSVVFGIQNFSDFTMSFFSSLFKYIKRTYNDITVACFSYSIICIYHNFRTRLLNNSLIIRLNLPSSPTTIIFTIMSLTTNSINRCITFSKLLYVGVVRAIHISLKLIKRLPQVLYSTTSVVLKRLVLWFVASTNNLSINVIKSSSKHSVLGGGFPQGVYPSTATRFSMVTFKIITLYKSLITTITNTNPNRIFAFNVRKLQNLKLVKFFTRQINKFTHTESIVRLSELVKQDGVDNDISGKVDTNNPIYKFYNKEMTKYLQKFGGKQVVDENGVSWIEVPIKKEWAKIPVEAFAFAPLMINNDE